MENLMQILIELAELPHYKCSYSQLPNVQFGSTATNH